jgi:hypothetical protein
VCAYESGCVKHGCVDGVVGIGGGRMYARVADMRANECVFSWAGWWMRLVSGWAGAN